MMQTKPAPKEETPSFTELCPYLRVAAGVALRYTDSVRLGALIKGIGK